MQDKNINIYEETVKTLKQNALLLQEKFHRLQNSHDIKASIDCLRLLKDTLSLIKEYDWHLEYSEYEVDNDKQISIWEQNHCGDIRNHKIWDVTNKKNDKNKWEDILRFFIENKQSMLFELAPEKEYRCTGKTTAIEKLAIEYGLPIFTNSINAKFYNNKIKNNNSRAFANWDSFKGYNTEIILVDADFKDCSVFDDLIKNKQYVLIGFKNTGNKNCCN